MADRVLNESKKRITGNFTNNHLGVDLGWRKDERENIITAHSAGIVEKIVDGKNKKLNTTSEESYGNFVLINHGNGYKTRYAHMKKNTILVKVNDKVETGTKLGVIGDSGNARGRHLHFEVYKDGTRINPENYLDQPLPRLSCKYQAHDKTYGWNSDIEAKINPGTANNEYAGSIGHAIDAIRIDDFTYRVHVKGRNWLPWVSGRSLYAGNYGQVIDGIQIENAIYRVHIKGGAWLPWVSKTSNNPDSYAGIYGKEIDAFQIKLKEA